MIRSGCGGEEFRAEGIVMSGDTLCGVCED